MKKRILAGLLGTMMMTVTASGVQAKTYAYDFGGEKTGGTIYNMEWDRQITGDGDLLKESDAIWEYGNADEIQGLSEEERERMNNWYKEIMRQEIAYLKEFGVTYDEEADKILYNGKTVRWLFDEQMDGTGKAIQMPEGEIDIYTQRSEDFKLTGIRVATEEEFQERTKKDENAANAVVITRKENSGEDYSLSIEAVEEGTYIQAKEAEEEISVQMYEADGEASAQDIQIGMGISAAVCEETCAEDTEKESIAEDQMEEKELEYIEAEACEATAVESASLSKQEKERIEQERKEYEQSGIRWDNGQWVWQGKAIRMLLDEDGAFYTCGTDEAIKNKIYIVVKRNEDGSIKEARQVSIEEIMEEQMKNDLS